MSKTNAQKPPKITIVVDSNVLFSPNVDQLFSADFSGFARSEATSFGLHIDLILPDVVVSERRRQMLAKATSLSDSVEKLQRLIGANWGLTPQTLGMHIDSVISSQLLEHGISTLSLDAGKVDWGALIDSAIQRVPPFSPEKEKGFKDAVILECVAQIVDNAPSSRNIHRILFLTADDLLNQAAIERFKSLKNVNVLSSLDEVRTQLNAIAAHMDQAYLEKLIPKAKLVFWDEANKGGIYYKDNVFGKIVEKYSDVLGSVPENYKFDGVKNTFVYSPTFLSKEAQKINFSTKIERTVRVTKVITRQNAFLSSVPRRDPQIGNVLGPNDTATISLADLLASSSDGQAEIAKTGRHIFNVAWSATLTVNGNLSKPTLGEIEFVSTSWEAEP